MKFVFEYVIFSSFFNLFFKALYHFLKIPYVAFIVLHWACGHLEKKLCNGYRELKFIYNSTCNVGF